MKIFPKEADYAIRALIFLAQRQGNGENLPFSTAKLAQELGLPLRFLRRIVSTLTGAGILESCEGKHGGVTILMKPATINLLSLLELFQNVPDSPFTIADCTFRKQLCQNRKTCVLRKRLTAIEKELADHFRAITLQTLLDEITMNDPTSR